MKPLGQLHFVVGVAIRSNWQTNIARIVNVDDYFQYGIESGATWRGVNKIEYIIIPHQTHSFRTRCAFLSNSFSFSAYSNRLSTFSFYKRATRHRAFTLDKNRCFLLTHFLHCFVGKVNSFELFAWIKYKLNWLDLLIMSNRLIELCAKHEQ